MTENYYYRVSAKALIRNENNSILLLREEDWTWDLPGWWWWHDEKLKECVNRNLLREIWCWVKDMWEVPVFLWKVKNNWNERLILLFEIIIDSFDIKPTWIYEAEWALFCSEDEINNNIKLHNVAKWLKKYLSK